MKIPADLVVLSACNTGRGTALPTEGLLGLSGAFLYAGAPRVISSLWKVEDDVLSDDMVNEGIGPDHTLKFQVDPKIIQDVKSRFDAREELYTTKAAG